MFSKEAFKSVIRAWRGYLFLIVALLLVRGAIADWYNVPTGSMKPTIIEGDRVFVNKMAYGLRVPFTETIISQWGEPQRGEIVVFHSPEDGTRLIKRVIGLPGDTLEMRDNRLLINGKMLEYSPADKSYPVTLWENEGHRDVIDELLAGHRHPIALTQANILIEDFAPLTVPANQYFMMGDNRHNSADSRVIGFVDRSLILGRASHVVMSLDYDNHYLPRKGRILTKLP